MAASHKKDSSPMLALRGPGQGRSGRIPNEKDLHWPESWQHLNLVRTFGIGPHVPFLNLSVDNFKCVFYATSHVGVLYLWEHNRQVLLQGHNNQITCASLSQDKKYIVTGDMGKEHSLIMWNTFVGEPEVSRSNIYPEHGIRSLSFLWDDQWMATVSGDPKNQVVSIWDTNSDFTEPLLEVNLKDKADPQHHVAFHPSVRYHFLTSGLHKIVFYQVDLENLQVDYCVHSIPTSVFKLEMGAFSMSEYFKRFLFALTGTLDGYLVIWGSSNAMKLPKQHDPVDLIAPADRLPIRFMKMDSGAAVTFIKTAADLITLGLGDGEIHLFDTRLRFLFRFKPQEEVGAINSISDSLQFELPPYRSSRKFQTSPKPLKVPHFLAGSTAGCISSMVEGESPVMSTLEDCSSFVIICHPHLTRVFLCVGTHLQMIDYRTWKKEQDYRLSQGSGVVTCGDIDPLGVFFAVGTERGSLLIFTIPYFTPHTSFKYKYPSLKVTFSLDSLYLALMDQARTVGLFNFTKPQEGSQDYQWVLVARRRAHRQAMVDILFGNNAVSKDPILLTLGQDQMLLEYDATRSNRYGLLMSSQTRIDQLGLPTCMGWYPDSHTQHFLVISTTEHKFRFIDMASKKVVRIVLGPMHNTYIERFVIYNGTESMRPFLVYYSHNQLGMALLPLDGNPFRYLGLRSHHSGVRNLAISYDASHVFTSGHRDRCMFAYTINIRYLEATLRTGGKGMDPFYSLLSGGPSGELLKDMIRFFFTIQIVHKSEDSQGDTREWNVSHYIPVSTIPDFVRALGYFPTEWELVILLADARLHLTEQGRMEDSIDLDTLIKLVCNHRSLSSPCQEEVQWAFRVLSGGGDSLSQGELLQLLGEGEEKLAKSDVAELMTCLLPEELVPMAGQFQRFLPQTITPQIFANDFLGGGDLRKLNIPFEGPSFKSTISAPSRN